MPEISRRKEPVPPLNIQVDSVAMPKPLDPEQREMQDVLLINPDAMVFGVFDGMGGYTQGREAAMILSESVGAKFRDRRITSYGFFRLFAMSAWTKAQKRLSPLKESADTTGVVLKIISTSRGAQAMTAWTGDSRCIAVEQDEYGRVKIMPLTEDENLAMDVFPRHDAFRHFINDALDNINTEEELWQRNNQFRSMLAAHDNADEIIEAHERLNRNRDALLHNEIMTLSDFWIMRNLTFGISSNTRARRHMPRTQRYLIQPHTVGFIVSSDCLHDNLTTPEIEEVLRSSMDDPQFPDAAAWMLSEAAGKRSTQEGHFRAKPDDCAIVVVSIK